MKRVGALIVALLVSGCGQVVDGEFHGSPELELHGFVNRDGGPQAVIGLMWSLDGSYLLTNKVSLEYDPWDGVKPFEFAVYPNFQAIGNSASFAFVTFFIAPLDAEIQFVGRKFFSDAYFGGIDHKHVVLYSFPTGPTPTIPSGIVVDNPERLGAIYQLAEVVCDGNGQAQVPMHVRVVDDATLNITPDETLGSGNYWTQPLPQGPLPGSCLVLP
jgi:hypothetical protein